ncbi:hypothetical protein [Acidobacterium sp. S8]|uniref:hypothetical protein n=1 Tax=Acidobacterium sp. S8 TaxID=1641854 RepID=UPI00131CD5C6|nr:hypothetical protein [Acidobacterium sp. S8]
MSEDTQIRDDANELLNISVNYARRMLRRYGEFGPFAFSLDEKRELVNETTPRKDLPPDPALLLELLQQQITERSHKKEIIAAATAANVSLSKPSAEGFTDALLVEIEHQNGYCVKAFVPYRIGGGQLFRLLPRHIRFGAAQIQDGVARFFAQ